MIMFVAENMPNEILVFGVRIFPFIAFILMICFCAGLVREYLKNEVHVGLTLLLFGLSTVTAIFYFDFCKFNWSYSLEIDETAVSFIQNLLGIFGAAILYSVILILAGGLFIFAIIEKAGKDK